MTQFTVSLSDPYRITLNERNFYRITLNERNFYRITDPPSSGSAGGGAFVVKRPAHLRSAVAHRNASLNSSPSVERLSSPTKGAAGGGGSLNAARLRASGSSTTGATSPEACTAGAASGDNDVPRSHMLAIVLPSLEEFVHEREVLRNVLVDLQQHFAELDLDLECCTLFEMEDVLQNVDECVLLGELLAQCNATALVFIGDRYGEALLPLELRPEEFDALREAALETADDVAVLLNQFYVLDRGGGETGRAAEYQLKASRDPAGAQRLRRGLQRCARRLFDGDGALALQPDAAQRHAQLFKSFIEWCAHAAEANGQSVLVTRRFHGVQNAAAGGGMERWMDAAGSERAEHLNALKNALSTRLLNNPQQRLLSFLLDLRLQQKIEIDPSSWWTKCPKESAAYELELATKLTDRLKSLILAAHPNIEQPRHPPLHEPRTAAMAIVQAEHCVHSAHLASRIAPRWVPRGDAIDSHLEAIVKRLFDKDENQLKSAGLFVQFHGQPGSGKTAALCRLYQLVHDRLANAAGDGKQSPPPVVALARFSHLTDGTVFANEMLRNAFLIVCKQYMLTTPNANAEMTDAFLGAFHLTEVLAQAKALLEQAHTLQVLLLLDDVHLLRFGRALGRMDNALRKLANETIASLFRDADSDADAAEDAAGGASSAEERAAVAAAVLLFPRPIAKEGGAGVDIRRVRFHWYYLLYTGNVEALKKETLCFFPYLEAAFRACGLARLLSIFEECLQQILDHDLLVIFEQVLLPGIQTLIREPRQFVSEFLNRLRYTRAKNSVYLNILVEQAMSWTDNYADSSLLVPLTCWIPPPKMKQVLSFTLSQWKSCKLTILQPTHNHQHLLVAGNELAPDCIYMFHIASQLLVRTFASSDQKQVGAQMRVSHMWALDSIERDVAAVQQQKMATALSVDAAQPTTSQLPPATTSVSCVQIAPDEKSAGCGTADGIVAFWDLDVCQCMWTSNAQRNGAVSALCFSADSFLLLSGSEQGGRCEMSPQSRTSSETVAGIYIF
uniref:WD_REPEATS_REGION domain-containing protein n=1 Tax=Globodera pallida TaxID=36090 RepID=A0A183BPH8_GLOPA